jgi:cyclopropane-fatty-acyl-phospholipid synthase
MTTSEKPRFDAAERLPRAGLHPWRALLLALGRRLRFGQLTVETPSGERLRFAAPEAGPTASLVLHRWRALRRLLLSGDVGFAEAYMDGDWSSPELADLIELASRNESHFGASARGMALLRFINRLRHLCRPNTRRGSKRNIAQHYDLGNAFYAQWLDPGMTYSSAIFADPAATLEEAQAAKIARAAALLDLRGGERVLEIGCGWGAMAETLAARHGCSVTGLTLSQEQLAFANERFTRAGIGERARAQFCDYRDVKGLFDRIVSIEMFEAVGEAHWPAYFNALRERMVAGGAAVLQVISIEDARFEAYRRGADFIQRYIFPGGVLPSVTVMREQIARAGLSLTHLETFGTSYARTLAEWQRRFQRAWNSIAVLGFDQRFKRMWEYYLASCEAGFRSGAIDVGLYRIEKPTA